MKYRFIHIPLLLFVVFPNITNAQIENNLRLGDYHSDVRALQVILNKNSLTQVAREGPGSPGNESYFFGSKTFDAVKRFQSLYKDEILLPYDLPQPTGFVGQATRQKLNTLLENGLITPPQTNTIQSNTKTYSSPQSKTAPSFTLKNPLLLKPIEKTPKLFSIDPYQAKGGTEVVLSGEFFDIEQNTVFIGDNYSVAGIKSTDTKTLRIILPGGSILQNGKYMVWVTTSKGSSRNPSVPIQVFITDTPKPPPDVISVDPPSVTLDKDIVIKGNNFTQNGNNIYSTLGNIMNVPSSDGVTIKVNMASFPYAQKLKDAKGLIGKMWLTVQNDNGVDRTMYEMQVVVPE